MLRVSAVLCALGLFVVGSAVSLADDPADKPPGNPAFESLEWRAIGPARGGRAQAISGVIGDPDTYYMGTTGGGVWKTTNRGTTWNNITDGFIATGSVGDLAVAEADENVIYLGMGEADIRGNFSHGDGVYKSTDAGKTWKHVGLGDTRQIGRVAIHPNDADTVFVAALGHVFGPNDERGVFRSTDGGATWQNVLYIDDRTGAIDVVFDPNNPRVLFAGMWRVSRTPWSLDSGGETSGLYRSLDGGDTWEELDEGLPEGIKGKIGVSPSAAQRDLVYAIVEAEDGGVFKSTDGGDTWTRVNENRALRQRAWYYSHIISDPNDADTVYVMNVQFQKSADGGKTFTTIRVPHVDNHDLWIDPLDSDRMINANDGGANVTFDGAQTWSTQTNQPTAQFYRVEVDNNFPYRVYAGQQDNSTASVSSRASAGGNWQRDLYAVGGCECGYVAVNPDNPDIVYAGCYGGYMTRYDHSIGESRTISVWPEVPMGGGADAIRHRFQWTFPIVISPHDSEKVYAGGERVFQTTDGGASWQSISPDVTTNDKSKQQSSGGPITKDNTSVEYYCTVFTIAESPIRKGLIWAGSDDGLIHVTTNGGGSGGGDWKNVTPPGMDEWPMISIIEPSSHDADTAYAAVTRYKMNDFSPYIYKTTDRGRSWSLIVDGIGKDDFVRSVREDPEVPGLLYAGTETGVYVSLDDGGNWQSLRATVAGSDGEKQLPAVPVTDLKVKNDDLVISTQGRSFWIFEDLAPLRQMAGGTEATGNLVYAPAPAYRERWDGVRVHFNLDPRPDDEVTLAFFNAAGEQIRSYKVEIKEDADEQDDEKADDDADADEDSDENSDEDKPSDSFDAERGMNMYRWNLRHEDPVKVPGAVAWPRHPNGPRVPPGEYAVELKVGDETSRAAFTVLADPRYDTPQSDYDAQYEMLMDVHDTLSKAHTAVNNIRAVRAQIKAVMANAKKADLDGELKDSAKSIKESLKEIEEAIIQTKSKSAQDPLNFPIRLNDKIGAIAGTIDGDHAPTTQAREVFNMLSEALRVQLDALRIVRSEDIPAFNALVREVNVPVIVIDDAD